MCEYCMICGHKLSENNYSGIGYECLAALKKAKEIKVKSDKDLFFKMRDIEVNLLKDKFIEIYKDVKFRSDFRKSFYESIKKADHVSNKQLAIINDLLFERMEQKEYLSIKKKISYKKANLYESAINSVKVSRELIEIARRIIRNKQRNINH